MNMTRQAYLQVAKVEKNITQIFKSIPKMGELLCRFLQ